MNREKVGIILLLIGILLVVICGWGIYNLLFTGNINLTSDFFQRLVGQVFGFGLGLFLFFAGKDMK